MTLDEQLAILQAAKRGEQIERTDYLAFNYWRPVIADDHEFDFSLFDYRLADPYAALKAAAKDPTKQIKYGYLEWRDAGHRWEWTGSPEAYAIRDKPNADPYAELKAADKDPTKQIRCICCGVGTWYDSDSPYPWKWSFPPECYEIRDKPREA